MAVSALAIVLTLALVVFQNYVVRRTGSHRHRRRHGTLQDRSREQRCASASALFLSGRFDQPLIDAGVAALVALYLMHGAWAVGRGSLDVLMDRELPDADRRRIVDIARRHPEVQDVHDLRTRSGGSHQVHPAPHRARPDARRSRGRTRSATRSRPISQAAFPDAEIILHVDPFGVEERRVGFA